MSRERLEILAQDMNNHILKGCRGLTPHAAYTKAVQICKYDILEAANDGVIVWPTDEALESVSRSYASRTLNLIRSMDLF